MRWRLTQTFDKIFVLDLHGNLKKKETFPGGGKDKNIFDIQAGVAIILAVKLQERQKNACKVMHADLYGTRDKKFADLNKKIIWQKVILDEEMYFFARKNLSGVAEYRKGIKIDELFKISSTGIFSLGDDFIISHDRSSLKDRIKKLSVGDFKEADLNAQFNLGKNYAKWVISNAGNVTFDERKIVPLAYRPFDIRYTYFDNKLVWRPRAKVMENFLDKKNIALAIGRQGQVVGSMSWSLVSIVNGMVDLNYFYRGGEQVFPLYLYDSEGNETTNFNAEKVKEFTVRLKKDFKPEEILHYIYASLHSKQYREKNAEFLKTDFPHIPIPKDDSSFRKLVKLGKALRELHLMSSPKVNEFITTYPVAGSNMVEKPNYKDGKVWINKQQYFGSVPQAAWGFYIGGYQPAQKWLKDRKGRELSSDDIAHYQRIIKVLVETERVMGEIDKAWSQ